MKIYPKDPDLFTIYRRIKDGSIDLQPDFQRDLIWSKAKKQGLIDTIFREWQFPPVFLVVTKDEENLDVLDGQQRLNAIVEFIDGNFAIDGTIEPPDSFIKSLHGLTFDRLPSAIKSKFERYSIRSYELYDYEEGEPYELFFRLNQGVVLTPAEKRNTFYGPIREQVRDLVTFMGKKEINGARIGFNNNRLAYHDVAARLIYALHTKNLGKKITDANLIDLYRNGSPIEETLIERAQRSVEALSNAIKHKVRLSKPTLFTWLLFFSDTNSRESQDFFCEFDKIKEENKHASENTLTSLICNIYQERAASSVNDAIPVQLRLISIYLLALISGITIDTPLGRKSKRVLAALGDTPTHTEEAILTAMQETDWSFE